MSKISALFFDLDETLMDFDEEAYYMVVTGVCEALADRFPSIDAQRLKGAYEPLNRARWSGAIGGGAPPDDGRSGLNIWRAVWRDALASIGCHDSAAVNDVTETYVQARRQAYRLFEDVRATLDQLRGCYRLAVITNGPADTQLDKLEVTGLAPYFDAVVASGAVGAAKPNPQIFRHALRSLGVEPAAVWHTGDSLPSDVAGALNAGLTAVWLNRDGTRRDVTHPTPHHEITSLTELLELLP